ncbi:MAG: substrate-binding domain-containing protein, partial [Tropicimonas sp.]|uniref:substrate-binding domain-containing protein n=1 Tax=Tropicimonas sp. TaxID=2067044 RepID=UPI003A8A08A2
VSMMTVSNVIHNRPNVGAAQRKHVQGFIDTLGYVPNRAAQELAGVMRPRFGLLYPRYMTPFISAVIVGTLNASAQLNVDVSIQLARRGELSSLRKTIQRMQDDGIEGFLLPSPIAELAARAFEKKKLAAPAVAIAPGIQIPGMASVRANERQAAFELVSMLLDLGHTEIGHIGGPEMQSGSIARYEGYISALISRGIEPRPERVVKSEFNFQDGVRAAEELLARHPRVTAIFAANDTLAASALAVAHRHEFSLPGELSVVGYDDAPVAEQIWPALTTVHQDAAAMTERAVEILEKAVRAWREDRSALPHEDALFPYEIVHRASIAAPSGKGT